VPFEVSNSFGTKNGGANNAYIEHIPKIINELKQIYEFQEEISKEMVKPTNSKIIDSVNFMSSIRG